MRKYDDINDPGNSSKYWTGRECIERGCSNPAGTWWSPIWCFRCNVKRMDRISGKMDQIASTIEAAELEG